MHAWRGLDPRRITSVARAIRAAAFPAHEPPRQDAAVSAADRPATPAHDRAADRPEAPTLTR